MRNKTIILLAILISVFIAYSNQKKTDDSNLTKTVTINNIDFELPNKYQLFTWELLPKNIFFERKQVKEFINKDGQKHYYEVVYITSENLDWYQVAYLAQDAGGYLVSSTSKEENKFITNLISDKNWNYKNWAITKKETINKTSTYAKELTPNKVAGFIIEYEKL